MTVDGQRYQIFEGEKHELIETMDFTEAGRGDAAPHVANFLAAVRSRNGADLAAGIEEGHLSAALCIWPTSATAWGAALRRLGDEGVLGR